MNTYTLADYSESYQENASVYQRFAEAEDYPGHIADFLIEACRGKVVLDSGCGTGKYLELLSSHCAHIIGIEKASGNYALAEEATRTLKNASVLQSCASATSVESNSIDVVIACWMLGTVTDQALQERVVSEWHRVVKPGGTILLVENALGGEFETIRGRFPDTTRTAEYNDRLQHHYGFRHAATFDSYFQFQTAEEAQKVIGSIWGAPAAQRVTRADIRHPIAVFEKQFAG